MKGLYNALKIILSLLIFAFAGYSAFQSWHFSAHRDMYAPWYYTIIFAGVITAVVGVIIIIALAIVKKRMK